MKAKLRQDQIRKEAMDNIEAVKEMEKLEQMQNEEVLVTTLMISVRILIPLLNRNEEERKNWLMKKRGSWKSKEN